MEPLGTSLGLVRNLEFCKENLENILVILISLVPNFSFACVAICWGRWRIVVKDQGLESHAHLGVLALPLPAV